jgi:hypothetical protein
VITRKLHCSHDTTARTLTIAICHLDDIERPRTLVSSTDGVVAMEVHAPKRDTVRGWRTLAKRTIAVGPYTSSDMCRSAALAAFADPDVGSVTVEVGPLRHLFVKTPYAGWLRDWSTAVTEPERSQLVERPLV